MHIHNHTVTIDGKSTRITNLLCLSEDEVRILSDIARGRTPAQDDIMATKAFQAQFDQLSQKPTPTT